MSKSTFNPLACAMAGVAAVLSMAHCPAIADEAVERGRSARARILDAVKAGGGTIDISEGTYVFDAAEAEDRTLCISSGEQPLRRKVVFPIEGVKGLTISGHGAKFLFRGQAVPFAILGSRDVVLNGVSVGWEPPCPAVLVAGGCSNVIVRGNVFSKCLASARHRCPAKLLHVDSADGVAFRDNRIFMRGDCAAWPEQKLFSVSNSANVTIGVEKSVPPDWLDKVVLIESTFDGTAQFAYYEPPPGEGKAPLLVGLHTWSYDLSNLSHYVCELNWCRRNGWGFIAPNCRGPNWTPQGCG